MDAIWIAVLAGLWASMVGLVMGLDRLGRTLQGGSPSTPSSTATSPSPSLSQERLS